MLRQNHVRKNESGVSDAEYRRSVAEEVCKALNITTSDTWRITEEPGETFITIRSDGDNAIIDGTFCEVEVTNNWVSCFAYPTNEGGDYILIGKFRCLDRNLLDKVTALDGCGAECAIEAKRPSNRPLKSEADSKALKFADLFVPDALWDKADIAMKAKRNQWGIPDAAETGILICTNFNKLCELEGQGVSKDRLLKQASYVQDTVQRANREMDGSSWMASWKRWLGSDFSAVQRQMKSFAGDLANAVYDLKNSKESRNCRYESLDTLRSDMSQGLIDDLKSAWKSGNRRAEIICLNHRSEIADLLKKYGVDMYDTSVSFYDFRGGYDSLARDILLCADILTEDDLYGESRIRNESTEVYSQAHVVRAKEVEGLKGQELFDELRVGDILTGTWGYNRTITEWFIIKRKTAKRVVVHKLTRRMGGQPGDGMGGWTTCPDLPPKEDPKDKDIQGMVRAGNNWITISDYPKSLYVWDGRYGWENMD